MNAASINRAQKQKLPSAHARAGVAIGNNNLRFKVARRVGVVELLASPSARRVGEHAASSIGAGEVRVGRGRRESAASLTARAHPVRCVWCSRSRMTTTATTTMSSAIDLRQNLSSGGEIALGMQQEIPC